MLWIKSVRKKLFKKTRKKLVNKIIVSSFFKGKMNILLINIVSFVLRLHINSLLCYLFCPGTSMLDFSLQILISGPDRAITFWWPKKAQNRGCFSSKTAKSMPNKPN